MKTTQLTLLFFVFGIVASFLSLIIAAALPGALANNDTLLNIAFLALIEELTKFSLLHFILTTHSFGESNKFLPTLFLPVCLGLGFSFFELSMIFFQQNFIPLEALYPSVVHVLTSILLANALIAFNKHYYRALFSLLTLLAVFIHVCYNVTIIKII